MAAFLADLLVLIHFLIVAFCVLGEAAILLGALFRWAWIRALPFRLAHLGAILFVAAESLLGLPCPLTEWEYLLRRRAGQSVEAEIGFFPRLLRALIFWDLPPSFFTALYAGFGLLALLTLLLVRPRGRKGLR